MLEIAIYVVVGLFTIFVPFFYIRHEMQKSRKAAAQLKEARELGLDEPVSIHPSIDQHTCIGTGACVKACPEKNVLGLIGGRGQLVNPSRCIGHGMCQAACPVDAISLVFGTEKRGIDIPHLKGTFETNVHGIYIAGELGGMGLIRNAVTQGLQAAENIARSLKEETAGADKNLHDLVIVGAGPAGIAASLQAKQDKLRFITIDQDSLGGTILTYPRRKLVMTQPMNLPGIGKIKVREIQKENLLSIFQDVFQKTDLKVRSGNKVEDIQRENGHFRINTSSGETFRAKRVLLAIGRRGSPRKLGVPGEESAKVAYRLMEPERFAGLKILVVGGGDSAVEAAVALSEQPDTIVHLSYRRDSIFRIKQGNRERLDAAVDAGKIKLILPSHVTAIHEREVVLDKEGEAVTLPSDQVFIFAGGELPIDFLKKAGIEFTRKFGEA